MTTGSKDYGTHGSLYSVLTADRKDAPRVLTECIKPSNWDHDLHVLPASPLLESAERELIGVAGAPYRLADPLSKIAHQYGAIVIDTRPSFSLMTEMALLTATDAIIPVVPGYKSDGTIPCIIIPGEQASAFRQARENTARSGLSAIALARQA